MTEKLDLVCQHASKDRGAATAGRVANQERQRIERLRSDPVGTSVSGQAGWRSRNRPNKSAKLPNEPRCDPRAAMSLCRYVDLSLTREGWIRSKRRWSNFGATQGWPKTRKRNRSNDLD